MRHTKYVQVTAEVEVDVCMGDFADETLVEEIKRRGLEHEFVKSLNDDFKAPVTLLQKMKLDIVLSHYGDKSLTELEHFFTK